MAQKRSGSRVPSGTSIVPVERVERSILVVRDQKVLLDRDLATIYGVETRVLVQAVKRNMDRFPVDFMFRLTPAEHKSLTSQSVMSNLRGGRRSPPYAFTEHGAVMLASVLNSPCAVAASLFVVRAFVRLRQLLSGSEQLRRKLDDLEKRLTDHDEQIASAFDAIRQLMDASEEDEDPNRPRIGYETEAGRTARRPGARARS